MAKRTRTSQREGTGTTSPTQDRLAGIILCGGSGSRMGNTRSHKVCEPVADRPAIVRLIDTLQSRGVDPICVVVGHRAGDVVQTIGTSHPGILYVYQRDQLGTGHAARIGVEALDRLGFDGDLLMTMGDKWLAPDLITKARQRFQARQAELLLVTTPKRPESTAGRLVSLGGRGIVGIVERRDIERAHLLEDWLEVAHGKKMLTRAALRRMGLDRIHPAKKLWRALGPLASFARGTGRVRSSELVQAIKETGAKITVANRQLTAEQVERRSQSVNESVYVGQLAAVRDALRQVGRDNAQDEFYLTDIVEIIAARARGNEVSGRSPVSEYRATPEDVLAFNTRQELRRVEAHVRQLGHDRRQQDAARRLKPHLRTGEQWLTLLSDETHSGRRLVEREYGTGGALVRPRLRALRRVVRLFMRQYGADRRLFLVRGPGRVNLMGRHIDHQGGPVHSTAIDSEVVMAVAPRSDDVIKLVNADPVAFPNRDLVISDWRSALRGTDWLSFVDGQAVKTHLMSTAGDWSNYVLAAALYLQHGHADRRIRGMDVAVTGDVPRAAGLSSSSSVVVATMEAVAAVNAIQLTPTHMVEACGRGEWFVGSRGGAADHAAIRLSQAGHLATMAFHPFRLGGQVPLPDEAAILVAYSGQHAVKSAGARDRFNERVACYRLGILLLRQAYPKLAERLQFVRDLLPHRHGQGITRTVEMLQSLPVSMARAQLRRRLTSAADDLETIFASHRDPGSYRIREAVTFGVGEIARSRAAARLLRKGDLAGFGKLMLLSHDGDRVTGPPAIGETPSLGGGIDSASALTQLVGSYGCSTERIDRIVDISRCVKGVYGAQIAGAGLGGCVMILADRGAVGLIKRTLAEQYYRPVGMNLAVWDVRPVNGGGLLVP